MERKYNKLYKELIERIRGVAAKVGRKKYGYMSSNELVMKGRWFLLAK